MMPLTFRRTALAAALLWPCAAWAGSNAAPHVPDVDTSNGVAAVPPGVPAAVAANATSPTPIPAPAAAPPKAAAATVATSEPARSSDVQRYCQNIAAAAAEARNAWQAKKLTDLQAQVAKTVADLEAREAALKDVLARRDDALKRADATLVSIFAKMRPDTAAAQLSALDDDLAAAVLQQLNPRAASAILNEIAPERAVRLVNTIAGTSADGKKS